MTIKNLHSADAYDISSRKIKKRQIIAFDLEKKKIVLSPLYENQNAWHRTFDFESLDQSSLKGDLHKLPVIFFSNEDAVKGLIDLLENDIKNSHDEIASQEAIIKKAEKRLNILKSKEQPV